MSKVLHHALLGLGSLLLGACGAGCTDGPLIAKDISEGAIDGPPELGLELHHSLGPVVRSPLPDCVRLGLLDGQVHHHTQGLAPRWKEGLLGLFLQTAAVGDVKDSAVQLHAAVLDLLGLFISEHVLLFALRSEHSLHPVDVFVTVGREDIGNHAGGSLTLVLFSHCSYVL